MDKAPRDAANDLLIEIEEMRFSIRELGIEIHANPRFWPILVITSNSERTFPDPFLRRCVFHHLEFPDHKRLLGIVADRVSSLGRAVQGEQVIMNKASPLLNDAVTRFRLCRDSELDKAPGTAELIAFVIAAVEIGKSVTQPLRLTADEAVQLAGVIGKTRHDKRQLQNFAGFGY
jgi:MoxR-like ATPase